MPRVHHVKKAAKDNAVAKKGEPYYWWEFRYGGKRLSKTYPKPSQLTQSKMSEALAAGEDAEVAVSAAISAEDIASALREAAETIRGVGDEYQESLYNMPESLQGGQTGQDIEEKVNNLGDWADSLEADADEVESMERGDFKTDNEYVDAMRDKASENISFPG